MDVYKTRRMVSSSYTVMVFSSKRKPFEVCLLGRFKKGEVLISLITEIRSSFNILESKSEK